MKLETILLPIDITKCPLEVFELVDRMAGRPGVTVVLLHVMEGAPGGPDDGDAERARQVERHLRRLADRNVRSMASTVVCVRAGDPAEEILAVAKIEGANLILLPSHGPTLWEWMSGLWNPGTRRVVSALAERVIREATCGVFVVQAKTRFNCEKAWGSTPKERANGVSEITPKGRGTRVPEFEPAARRG